LFLHLEKECSSSIIIFLQIILFNFYFNSLHDADFSLIAHLFCSFYFSIEISLKLVILKSAYFTWEEENGFETKLFKVICQVRSEQSDLGGRM
jgi:hypothetical protein